MYCFLRTRENFRDIGHSRVPTNHTRGTIATSEKIRDSTQGQRQALTLLFAILDQVQTIRLRNLMIPLDYRAGSLIAVAGSSMLVLDSRPDLLSTVHLPPARKRS